MHAKWLQRTYPRESYFSNRLDIHAPRARPPARKQLLLRGGLTRRAVFFRAEIFNETFSGNVAPEISRGYGIQKTLCSRVLVQRHADSVSSLYRRAETDCDLPASRLRAATERTDRKNPVRSPTVWRLGD